MLGRAVGQQAGQRGLARAGGAPQDGRADAVGFGQGAQRGAGPDQVLLAHHLVEGARAQPGGQGGALAEPSVGGVVEQAHDVAAGSAR